MKKIYYIIALMCALPLSMAAMCGEPIPVREMSRAKLEISNALSVKANKYAPDEMVAADKALYASHDFIKNEELDNAKTSAITAFKKAREAYEKSLPLLAKDTMDIAEKSLDDATEAYASELAKDDYAQAQDALKKAAAQYEEKKFLESYRNALEADMLAKNARNAALGKQGILRDAVDEVVITIAEAKRYNAAEYCPDKLNAAEENNKTAEDALASLELKKGFAAVDAAKVNADEAYLIALKKSSEAGIADAGSLIEKAEKSEGAAAAKDELDGSKEALAAAKAQYDDAKYRESMSSSSEAKRLAAAVIAVKKADAVVKPGAKGEKETAVIEGTPKRAGETIETATDYTIYKVVYNPSRRDCLWRIAGKFYDNPRLWKKIFNANRDIIRNPHIIHPGMKLKVPVLKKEPVMKKDEAAVKPKEPEYPEKESDDADLTLPADDAVKDMDDFPVDAAGDVPAE